MRNSIVAVIATLALVLGGVAFFGGHIQLFGGHLFGGQLYETDQTQFFNGFSAGKSKQLSVSSAGALTLSSTGNAVSGLQFGSCTLRANGTIAATSTKNLDCAVTGALSTDTNVRAWLPASSTPALAGGLGIIGASASSTNGYITVTVQNLTGATYTFGGTKFGSSTPYQILR